MNTLSKVLRDADPAAHEPRSEHARAATRAVVLGGPQRVYVELHPVPRRRTLVLAGAVALAGVAAAFFVWPRASVDAHAAMRFEARIAGADEAIVDNHDILTVRVVKTGTPSAIEITFTAEGAEKMRRATEAHIGEHLEIRIDDAVVMAPTIRGATSSPAMLTGDFTPAEAKRIVDGLLKGKLEISNTL